MYVTPKLKNIQNKSCWCRVVNVFDSRRNLYYLLITISSYLPAAVPATQQFLADGAHIEQVQALEFVLSSKSVWWPLVRLISADEILLPTTGTILLFGVVRTAASCTSAEMSKCNNIINVFEKHNVLIFPHQANRNSLYPNMTSAFYCLRIQSKLVRVQKFCSCIELLKRKMKA